MLHANNIVSDVSQAVDTITLDEGDRHRRRIAMTSDGGIAFLLNLPQARLLRHGEGIELSDGRVIEVIAKPEALYEVHARSRHHLLSLAWQLGNRHLPTQILSDHLRIRADHVIKQMLIGLGGEVCEIEASFDPEGGAYGDHHSHGDNKDHSHD